MMVKQSAYPLILCGFERLIGEVSVMSFRG